MAEYDPVTHRKVPKYFAPFGTLNRLIPKPTAEERRPARIDGQRSLSLSEKWAKNNKTIARRNLLLGW